MSSDEADTKNVDENTLDTASSAEENEEKEEVKEEKVNSKPAPKKKAAEPPKIKQPAKKRVKTEQAEKETKKEDKKEEKKKAQPVDEEDDEDEESADENNVENHKGVPLLDQPLEITGSRKRKEVQRFKPAEVQEESNKEVKIPKGKGKALGDIPRVEFNLQRARPEDLKILHRLCFGGIGKAATLKKTLRKFNGFEYEEASDDYEKKKTIIEKSFKKVTIAHLKNVCNVLDLEKSGTKDDILERILSFLVSPVDSGKKLPGTGRSKRKGATSKNYDEGEERFDSKKKGSKTKKKSEDSGESEDEKDESEEEEEEEEVKQNNKKKEEAPTTEESAPEDEEEEKEKEVEKPKKGAKKAAAAKKSTEVADKKAPPKKRAVAKKAAEKKSESEGEADNDNESEEDEPLVKKAKSPPTDEEIKTYVKSLLEGANLELITMKKVCQDVYAHYPDFDLGHKKDFIKTTVKSLISS